MEVSQADLEAAVAVGVLPAEQLAPLLGFLEGRRAATAASAPPPRFDLSHVLWYAGALIVMSAMGLFSTLAFSAMGGTALTVTAVIYAGAFVAAGQYLWRTKNLRVPAGLLITIAVSMMPLAVYGIQSQCKLWGEDDPGSYQDFFNWSENSWIYMEVATIAAAGVALWRYKFPFLVFVVAVMLWFMSMDVGAFFNGDASLAADGSLNTDQVISEVFGLAMMGAAWAIDRRRFAALTQSALALPPDAAVRVCAEKEPRTLTISDPGIGMDRESLVSNLGTIARSGTRAFGQSLADAKPEERPSLIGQFGVGFYSAFMVADRVEVTSRAAGTEEAWVWASEGRGDYTIAPNTA